MRKGYFLLKTFNSQVEILLAINIDKLIKNLYLLVQNTPVKKNTILLDALADNHRNRKYPALYDYCILPAPAKTVCPPILLAEPPLFSPDHPHNYLPPEEYL